MVRQCRIVSRGTLRWYVPGTMHTHFGALAGIGAFLSVLLFGTLWRLIAAHMVASSSSALKHVGGAMSAQY
jgi:hypothetical protein